MLTDDYVIRKFGEGIDCSMMVLAEFADDLGITKDESYKIASCFGSGMLLGSVCGAVTGAFIVIGMKHGNCELNDLVQKSIVLSKRDEFVERFEKEHGSVNCPVLLGADLRDDGQRQRARESGVIDTECPKFCRTAVRILKEIL